MNSHPRICFSLSTASAQCFRLSPRFEPIPISARFMFTRRNHGIPECWNNGKSQLLSAEADSLRDKGTEWQRGKVISLCASLSALCLCAFATLCLHRAAETKLKSSPEGEGFSPIPRGGQSFRNQPFDALTALSGSTSSPPRVKSRGNIEGEVAPTCPIGSLKGDGFDSLDRFFEAFLFLCQSDAKIPFSRFTKTIARRDDHTLFKQACSKLC
jgi:hypothetical protein